MRGRGMTKRIPSDNRILAKRVVADVIEIGRRLTEAKPIAGHGNWLAWLEREFKWTEMTATRFINVYKMSKSNNLLDLELPISGQGCAATSPSYRKRAAIPCRSASFKQRSRNGRTRSRSNAASSPGWRTRTRLCERELARRL
jgi:Protein of unknown function (DUF3102)